MRIKKAVITAAARGERLYPVADTIQKAMLPVIDIDGLHKPVLQIIAEEAFSSGIEEICIVCAPGDGERYKSAFTSLRNNLLKSFKNVEWAREEAEKIDHLLSNMHFAEQLEPLGYGHAVYTAKEFVGDDPFLLLLGDYLYVSDLLQKRCAAQLIESCNHRKTVLFRQLTLQMSTRLRDMVHLPVNKCPGQQGVYQIEKIIEKPSLSLAELELQTPGLRVGYYLCFLWYACFYA